MKFDFGKKLKELRLAKGVTQEQLADHLKISGQAVSKWERNEGYPDIILLPRIALYFGVTVDDLLGVAEEQLRQQIADWKAQSRQFQHDGDRQKDYALWKAAYEFCPSHPDVKEAYIDALYYIEGDENREEVIRLSKELLAESADAAKRRSAIINLVLVLSQMERFEEAREYADMAAPLLACRELLYRECLTGEEKLRHSQHLLCTFTDCAAEEARIVALSCTSPDETIPLYQYILGLYRGLFSDGNFGFYHCRMHEYSENLAEQYALAGQWDECLRAVSAAADHAVQFDRRTEKRAYTAPAVNRIADDPAEDFRSETTTECGKLLGRLGDVCYDPVRDHAEFRRITAMLEARAVR